MEDRILPFLIIFFLSFQNFLYDWHLAKSLLFLSSLKNSAKVILRMAKVRKNKRWERDLVSRIVFIKVKWTALACSFLYYVQNMVCSFVRTSKSFPNNNFTLFYIIWWDQSAEDNPADTPRLPFFGSQAPLVINDELISIDFHFVYQNLIELEYQKEK